MRFQPGARAVCEREGIVWRLLWPEAAGVWVRLTPEFFRGSDDLEAEDREAGEDGAAPGGFNRCGPVYYDEWERLRREWCLPEEADFKDSPGDEEIDLALTEFMTSRRISGGAILVSRPFPRASIGAIWGFAAVRGGRADSSPSPIPEPLPKRSNSEQRSSPSHCELGESAEVTAAVRAMELIVGATEV